MEMTMECWLVGLFIAWLRAGVAVNASCSLLTLQKDIAAWMAQGCSAFVRRVTLDTLSIPICLIWVPFGPAQLSGTNVPTVGQHPVLGQASLAQSTDRS